MFPLGQVLYLAFPNDRDWAEAPPGSCWRLTARMLASDARAPTIESRDLDPIATVPVRLSAHVPPIVKWRPDSPSGGGRRGRTYRCGGCQDIPAPAQPIGRALGAASVFADDDRRISPATQSVGSPRRSRLRSRDPTRVSARDVRRGTCLVG
jgi:hypothetical protein